WQADKLIRRQADPPSCDTRSLYKLPTLDAADTAAFYEALARQLAALPGDERDRIANLADAAALVSHTETRVYRAGLERMQYGELVLGPFQGKPACVRIAVGNGVCGTAVATGRAIRVEDVNQSPGHIACDADSRSDLVLPLHEGGRVIGVFDLDSPERARFSEADEAGFARLVRVLEATWT